MCIAFYLRTIKNFLMKANNALKFVCGLWCRDVIVYFIGSTWLLSCTVSKRIVLFEVHLHYEAYALAVHFIFSEKVLIYLAFLLKIFFKGNFLSRMQAKDCCICFKIHINKAFALPD